MKYDEKVVKILMTKDYDEMQEYIDSLTELQKKTLITSLVKWIQQNNMSGLDSFITGI